MFGSVTRAITFLARTPLVLPPAGPAAMELATISSSSAGPSRPRAASRAFSNVSTRSAYAGVPMQSMHQVRGYASDKGKKELYSDEAGSPGAGTDDVAHTSAAFDKNPDPESSAKQVEQETGKDFTKRSAANPDNSAPLGEQGGVGSTNPLQTSRNKKE